MSVISNDLIAQLDLSKLLSYFLPILVDTYFFSIRRRFYHSISLFLRRGPEQRPGCPSRPQSNRICPKLDFVLGCGGEFTNVWSTPAIPSLLRRVKVSVTRICIVRGCSLCYHAFNSWRVPRYPLSEPLETRMIVVKMWLHLLLPRSLDRTLRLGTSFRPCREKINPGFRGR
ncbi:hypothetical protein AUEXF2481DRAFT_289338 [Aureobasidium subglaciale EXF-2481]|uniref:Uncharacterized protein n=1 Tax=Aureobasidium subglaciale (strain EXF-2481) TaxID=1043005 RepID=A0A074YDA1_AURSE|nr:uncharacterized protein AUEXF2481DRAFT_289338 [Aureobasidium subglaciale EXF-2481]KEQ94024.1 hypothetical protein AUEXF2481DRAFT_289338 [Aureobasidium subglaciale EXF-2481]